MTLYVNHIGFSLDAAKFCLLGGPLETGFVVKEVKTGNVVYEGRLQRVQSDFGVYTGGVFSEVRKPGVYVVEAGREQSYLFRIGDDVYDETLQMMVEYFKLQRCGKTDVGWNSPCHTDDGLRGDTWTHKDVEGGWHDACDLRKWGSATIFGMLGLLRLKEVLSPSWDKGEIEDELRWGNRYFLKMQEPEGYMMNHCGGDFYVHADKTIDTCPCDTTAQWIFVLVQSALSRLVKNSDPAYSKKCEEAARRCSNWLLAEERTETAGELGVSLSALVELHKLTSEDRMLETSLRFADGLLDLQVTRQVDARSSVWGFFLNRDDRESEPFKSIWKGCWPLLGLCELLDYRPEHEEAEDWRRGIQLFCENYLEPLTRRNAFGIVPYGLYRKDPGGNRNLGRFWYRWFYEENPIWYVGVNANLASAGVGLVKAARLLNNEQMAALAQRQLDWILGVNPFSTTTVMGAGHNNPQHMFGGEFYPPTPFLPGAVTCGISGDTNDFPQLRPGSYHECEYWTPMVCFTIWLMAELDFRCPR